MTVFLLSLFLTITHAYLDVITAVPALVGVLTRYFMPLREPKGILLMIALILLSNVSVPWFVFAIVLGTISYAHGPHPNKSVRQESESLFCLS